MQRSAYVHGGQMRAIAALAQQVFAFVPPGERRATLHLLRQLDSADRQRLGQLGLRLGRPQREQLRADLLQLAPSERSAYLARRLSSP
jgi:hypothetical protein